MPAHDYKVDAQQAPVEFRLQVPNDEHPPAINLKTAKALAQMPTCIVLRGEKVIE